jgi:hypothetical protein
MDPWGNRDHPDEQGRRMNDWPDWVTPAMVLAASLWIVREVRALGERLAHLEGRILGWQDRRAGPPKAS